MSSTLLLLHLFLLLFHNVNSLGGEKASFPVEAAMTIDVVNYRQDICDRHDAFQNAATGNRDLRTVLDGMQLNVLIGAYEGAYFNYNDETGIDARYPGLGAIIMDEIAKRGGFTWRDSFGIYTGPPPNSNMTWTDILYWGVDSYDVVVDWWQHNTWRYNQGVAFVEEWVDSSMILIEKVQYQPSTNEINLWNWLRPYDHNVWLMTIFTVLISGVVYQILEWFGNERDDRTLWQWWSDNLYLSSINFTQAYEYEPKTVSARIFGVSMAIWALVMTATYTANLASLLVDQRPPPPGPETLAEIQVFGHTVCVWEGTAITTYVQENFPSAKAIPKRTVEEMYQALHNGECDFMVVSLSSWNKQKAMKKYNPQCDLQRVGGERVVMKLVGGFATKADSGTLCTGLIRDLLNIHLMDMKQDGFLDYAWRTDIKRTQDIDCNTYRPELQASVSSNNNKQNQHKQHSKESPDRRRYLFLRSDDDDRPLDRTNQHHYNHDDANHRRHLKAGGVGAAAIDALPLGGEDNNDGRRLTPEQMIGTFVFHWGLMTIALFLAAANALYTKHIEPRVVKNRTRRMEAVAKQKASIGDNTIELSSQVDLPPHNNNNSNPNNGAVATTQKNVLEVQDLHCQMTSMQEDLHTILQEMHSLKHQQQSSSSLSDLPPSGFPPHRYSDYSTVANTVTSRRSTQQQYQLQRYDSIASGCSLAHGEIPVEIDPETSR